MRTARSALLILLALALVGMPAISSAASLAPVNADQTGCPDEGADATEDEAVPQQKAIPAKRGTARDSGKPRRTAPYRSSDTPSRSAPRWHRFLPGMYR